MVLCRFISVPLLSWANLPSDDSTMVSGANDREEAGWRAEEEEEEEEEEETRIDFSRKWWDDDDDDADDDDDDDKTGCILNAVMIGSDTEY